MLNFVLGVAAMFVCSMWTTDIAYAQQNSCPLGSSLCNSSIACRDDAECKALPIFINLTEPELAELICCANDGCCVRGTGGRFTPLNDTGSIVETIPSKSRVEESYNNDCIVVTVLISDERRCSDAGDNPCEATCEYYEPKKAPYVNPCAAIPGTTVCCRKKGCCAKRVKIPQLVQKKPNTQYCITATAKGFAASDFKATISFHGKYVSLVCKEGYCNSDNVFEG